MQFRPYYHEDYSGGLNDTASPKDIGPNEASFIRNWDITIQGKLVKRPGTSKIGNTISVNPITGLGAFLRNGGAQDVLAIEGGNLNYLNATTWAQLANNLTSGKLFWMENVQSLGKIFLGNEDNQLQSWDRTSTTLNTCITVLAATVPHGNVMSWHKNFMFQMNNVNVNGTKYPNRIYFSALGDPTTYTTTNDYFDCPGDGRVITGMDIGNNLAIFKERSIQYLSGWGANSWGISASGAQNAANVSEEVGIAGIHAMCKVGDDIWFIDNVGRVRSLKRTDNDAFRHDIISTKIEGTIASINRSQLAQAIAWSYNNKVYFAYPNGADTHNSILCVFDILAARREQEAGRTPEAWTVYDNWTPNLFISYPTSTSPDLYYGDATTGIVYKVDPTATSDNGTVINCRWDGKNDMEGAPDLYKNYGYGNITAQSSGTSHIDVYASIDQGAYTKLGTLTAASTGDGLGPTGIFRLGPTGKSTLGGSRQATLRYQYSAGGLIPTGKSLIMSIRHAVATEFAQVNTWSRNFRVFPAR